MCVMRIWEGMLDVRVYQCIARSQRERTISLRHRRLGNGAMRLLPARTRGNRVRDVNWCLRTAQ